MKKKKMNSTCGQVRVSVYNINLQFEFLIIQSLAVKKSTVNNYILSSSFSIV